MNTIYLSSIERQKNTYKGICGEVPQETDPDEVKKPQFDVLNNLT